MRIQPDVADQRFLALLGSSPLVRRQIEAAFVSTAGQKTVNQRHISSVLIPLPPRAEQERIVAAVEEVFSRIDAGAAGLAAAQTRLERMRDAIRFAATRGQLVPQDPDDEPAASLIAQVKPEGRFRGTKPLPPDLGPIPPGWSWALMGALAQRVTVGHVGPMKDEYVPDGIPFLRSQNVRADRFDPEGLRYISAAFHVRLSKSRLLPGDVVIVRSGNVGTACVIPQSLGEANCADLVIVQRPEAVDPYFGALYMNSLARSRVRAGRVGVALTHFNTQSVAELPVPVPPLNEQKRIVAEAQRLLSMVDALEADIGSGMKKARALRSSILTAAFSGHMALQDSADASASSLLERIATEHAAQNGRRSTARVGNAGTGPQKVTP
jgi:type I restriction enzyme S subunit